MERVLILGVPFDALTLPQAVDRLRALLRGPGQHHVATPNNEMLVAARRDAAFADVLRRTALNLPDSTGVVLASRFLRAPLPVRVTGVDTVIALCGQLDESCPVFLLGGADGVAERAAQELARRNPLLRIAGTFAGSPRTEDAPAILRTIGADSPHLLLVAYGAPAQEKWIAEHLHLLPSVRVAMGVGGTFGFLAGTKKRAPHWIRGIGLEWVWRFLLEPTRWKRMINAVIVFLILVLFYGKGK